MYQQTVDGRRLPLRRLEMHGPLLDDLTFTPTFAVVENGWEVGRIRGYPGDDFFWGLLGQILARLAPGEVVSGQAATR